MNCQETQSFIEAYLDSELDTRTIQQIQEHLANCPACAKAYADEERFQAKLSTALKRGERTASLWNSVEQRVASISALQASSEIPEMNTYSAPSAEHPLSWRFWLWPSPKVHVALAILWLLMLTVHFTSKDAAPGSVSLAATPPAALRTAWMDKRRQLTELLDLPGSEPPTVKVIPGRSRSQHNHKSNA